MDRLGITPLILIVALLALFTVPGAMASQGNLTVYYIDVGQGDSELLQINGHNILIDAGTSDHGPTVVNFLKGHGVSTIDLLVATHPHADHIGGMQDVFKAFTVKQVIDSGMPDTTQTYENFLKTIDEKNIPYETAERGQTINVDPSITIQVLSPPKGFIGDDLNTNSIVLLVTDGNRKFLFMGDATTDAEQSIMSAGLDVKADVLKVGHHGSKYSSSQAFLNQVKPSIAVIEVGADNDYGHPAQTTLDKLNAIGAQTYRTDEDGSITIATDGNTLTVNNHAVQTPSVSPTPTPTVVVTSSSSPSLPIANAAPSSPIVYGTPGILIFALIALAMILTNRSEK